MSKKAELVELPSGKHLWPTKYGLGKHLTPPRSDRQCRTWMKRVDWPFGDKDFIVEDIDAWRQEHLKDREAESATTKQASINLRHEQARLAKLKADALEGRFIERLILDRVLTAYVNMVRAKINEWCEALPPQMEGMSVAEMRTLMVSANDQLCEDMFQVAFVMPADDSEVETLKNERKVRAGKAKGGQRGRKKK